MTILTLLVFLTVITAVIFRLKNLNN